MQHVQIQQASWQSSNTQLQREHPKLWQKLTVKAEVQQHTVLRCYQKRRLLAKSQSEQEEKLSIVEEMGRCTTEELETYRK